MDRLPEQVERILEARDSGPSLAYLRVGPQLSDCCVDTIVSMWEFARQKRGAAPFLYLAATTAEAHVARRRLELATKDERDSVVTPNDDLPGRGQIAVSTYERLVDRCLMAYLDGFDAIDAIESLWDRASRSKTSAVILVSDMVRPSIESEVVLGVLAGWVSLSTQSVAVMCLHNLPSDMLEQLEEKAGAAALVDVYGEPAEHAMTGEDICYMPAAAFEGDIDRLVAKLVLRLLPAGRAGRDTVCFMRDPEFCDEINLNKPMREAYHDLSTVLVSETLRGGLDAPGKAVLDRHSPDADGRGCFFYAPPVGLNGLVRFGTVGLVVASDQTATPETFVDLATGLSVSGTRTLSTRELAAQHEHVLHARAPATDDGGRRQPCIIALYDEETERQARPVQTALTQNITTFVVWMAIFWPGRKLTDLPIRGMAAHAELVEHTVEALLHVRIVRRRGDGIKLSRPHGMRLLRFCSHRPTWWRFPNAAVLLSIAADQEHGPTKRLLVRLAWLSIQAKRLVDSNPGVLARGAIDAAGAWLADLNRTAEQGHRMGDMVRTGYLWVLLVAFVKTNVERLRGTAAAAGDLLRPDVAHVVWNEMKDGEVQPPLDRPAFATVADEIDSLEESCRILADSDHMPRLWDILGHAFNDKSFRVTRNEDGTYSAFDPATKAVLELGDHADYVDYVFTSALNGAKKLYAFTTHFELVGGRPRPHNITFQIPRNVLTEDYVPSARR